MTDDLARYLVGQGALGVVALAGIYATIYLWRAAREDRKAWDAERERLTTQIIDAHGRRADDAKVIAAEGARVLQANASASGATTDALREVRETLREWGPR